MTEGWIDTRLVVEPNASLSWAQAKLVIGWMCLVSLGIGLFFAVHGFWPVLPFCGMGLVAFAAGLLVSLRQNDYREVICFEGGRIQVQFGTLRRAHASTVSLQRNHTRVMLERGPYRNSPALLVMSCCGQRVEVGRCLTDDERTALCQRMQQLIHPGWVPPPKVEEEKIPQWDWK